MVKNQGFTLFELVITLAISAFLLLIAVPSLSHQIQTSKVKTAANSLLEAIANTRSLAVTRNQRATIQTTSEWSDDWAIYVDLNDNGTQDPDEETLMEGGQSDGVRIFSNRTLASYISFIGTGEGRKIGRPGNPGGFIAGSIFVCPILEGSGFKLILARGGRMRIESLPWDDCAQD